MKKGVFIVGAGRSGTKFMMNVLNNSGSVHLAPEIHYFSWLFHSGFRRNLRKAYKRKNGEYEVGDVVSCILNGRHFGTYWRRDNKFTEADIRNWFGGRRVDEENIYKYLVEYDARTRGLEKQPALLGEKGGANVFHLREITSWFPDARIIFMYRNPLDVLASEVNKGSKPDYPVDKRNPIYPYGLVPLVFMIWALGAINALRYKHKNKDIYLVSYDEMNKGLDDVARKIAAVCNIEYSEKMCKVDKEDSSFSASAEQSVWKPPAWVRALYRVFLNPLRRRLDRESIHRSFSVPSG